MFMLNKKNEMHSLVPVRALSFYLCVQLFTFYGVCTQVVKDKTSTYARKGLSLFLFFSE